MRVSIEHHLSELTRLVNLHLGSMPPGWQLTQRQVAGIVGNTGLWNGHYPETAHGMDAEIVTVFEGDRLAAAAQLDFPRVNDLPSGDGDVGEHPGEIKGNVSWMFAAPDQPEAAARLVERLVEQAERLHLSGVEVTARCSFGMGWMGVPQTWEHLAAGLQQAGFFYAGSWASMLSHLELADVPQPAMQKLRLERSVNEPAGEWVLAAYVEEQRVGECEAWDIPAHLSACAGAQRWVTLEWLGVSPAYRGRGLGRWLLNEQLRWQKQRGRQHAICWTETHNHIAQRVNLQAGFVYGPACGLFTRRSTPGDA